MTDKLVAEGKTKSLYSHSQADAYRMVFRDDVTAFDGSKSAQLARKGAVSCAINTGLMQRLEDAGVPTAHIERIGECEAVVKKLAMFPIESVVRNIAFGSLCRRLPIIEPRTALNPPVWELFLKDDDLGDPAVAPDLVVAMQWANAEQVAEIRTMTLKINDLMRQWMADAGMVLVDFKLEFGATSSGELVLGDELTPDSMRLWDVNSGESLDKDRFRNDQGEVVHHYEEIAKRLDIAL